MKSAVQSTTTRANLSDNCSATGQKYSTVEMQMIKNVYGEQVSVLNISNLKTVELNIFS